MKRLLPLLILILAGCAQPKPTEFDGIKHSAVELIKNLNMANSPQLELTDWQKLQMAIIFTESRFRADITGKNQDGGLYQMTPVFVREVNRVAGTDYRHEDVYNPDKAIEIFNTMHLFKNPGHNFEQAIRIHNKSAGYLNTVMQNYELICRMEEVRAKLIEYDR